MKPLKLLLVTEEDEFYLPLAIQFIIEKCGFDIESLFCIKNPTTASLPKTVKRFVSVFGIVPLLKHLLRLWYASAMNRIPLLNTTGRCFSVKAVAGKFNIPYRYIPNINEKEVIEWVRGKKIDCIISVSPTQLFSEALITASRYGCINVHSSLLPKHRGLYPVYWAMASGEREIGVSVHYMDAKIDTGDIILQEVLKIDGMKTMDDVLKKAKRLGAQTVVKAIGLIASDKVRRMTVDISKGSYHSFPDRESYRRFKELGYRLW